MPARTVAIGLLLVAAFETTPRGRAETAQSGGAWIDLFNGRNLDGWVQNGAAKYRAAGDEIVGTTVPGYQENSFLCTKRSFTNFVLELEFLDHPALNSGIQIRSTVADVETTEDWYGKKFKIPAGRVHGMQVEIDPSGRAWTGGIYGEAVIGWLNNLEKNEPARKAFKHGEWNKLRVEASGLSVKTWFNGVPAADLKADRICSGFIALEVHWVKEQEPLSIRFRNIRLQELPGRK